MSPWLSGWLVGLIVFGDVLLCFVWNAFRKLPQQPAAPSGRLCASCGQALGDYPVRVDDMVSSMVDNPPVRVTFFVCQHCMGHAPEPVRSR